MPTVILCNVLGFREVDDLLVLEPLDVAAEELVGREEHSVGEPGTCCVDRESSIHVGFEELNLWWLDRFTPLSKAVHLVPCLCRVNWVDQSPTHDTTDTACQCWRTSRPSRELSVKLRRRLIGGEVKGRSECVTHYANQLRIDLSFETKH